MRNAAIALAKAFGGWGIIVLLVIAIPTIGPFYLLFVIGEAVWFSVVEDREPEYLELWP